MFLDFLKKAFSDAGTPSSSRLLTLFHSLVASGCLIYVVAKNHTLPDGTVLGGLGAFSTAHYLVNRATTAFGKNQNSTPDDAASPADIDSKK
jgi:hypothetical protein